MKLNVSVFIVAQNEEAHIEKTLRSVESMDEVILVDSGSTDKTKEIAQRYGAKVVEQSWQGFAKQKQFAMSLCQHDWVLNLDGDEAITPEIVAEFKSIMENDSADSVRMWRDDIFIGNRYRAGAKKPIIIAATKNQRQTSAQPA